MKRWCRILGAAYLLAIFAGALLSPHRHENPIGDLLADGPSDSGTFLRAEKAAFGGVASLSGYTFVDDDPCLACFWHDFQSVASVHFSFFPGIGISSYELSPRAPEILSAPERLSIIRGPPARPLSFGS